MTPRNSGPNIFTYASKELSQDAMMCWLVACLRHKDPALRACSEAFIRFLFRAGPKVRAEETRVVNPKTEQYAWHPGTGRDISLEGAPSRQYRDMDIYFRARVDKRIVSFIIENKTASTTHDNQLTRYRQTVVSDDKPEHWIKPIYFKTGYLFEAEKRHAERRKYSVLDLGALRNFLARECRRVENDLVQQYRSYILGKFHQEREDSKRLMAGHVKLLSDVANQYRLMLSMRTKLENDSSWVGPLRASFASSTPENKDESQWHERENETRWFRKDVPSMGPAWTEIRHNTNNSKPWSELWFCNQFGWRVTEDGRLFLKCNFGEKRKSDEALSDLYKDGLLKAMAESGVNSDHDWKFQASKVITIGSLSFDRENQTPLRVIERLPALQREFLRRIPPLK